MSNTNNKRGRKAGQKTLVPVSVAELTKNLKKTDTVMVGIKSLRSYGMDVEMPQEQTASLSKSKEEKKSAMTVE